ncbi:MAG TPA: colanic acid biosynthesis glycosyltransferase WcaL, partial [Candidatus Paceibacterota bacterium]
VTHEQEGLAVNPDDTKALAEAVERLLHDEALRQKLVTRAREKSRQFGVERMLDELVPLLSK